MTMRRDDMIFLGLCAVLLTVILVLAAQSNSPPSVQTP